MGIQLLVLQSRAERNPQLAASHVRGKRAAITLQFLIPATLTRRVARSVLTSPRRPVSVERNRSNRFLAGGMAFPVELSAGKNCLVVHIFAIISVTKLDNAMSHASSNAESRSQLAGILAWMLVMLRSSVSRISRVQQKSSLNVLVVDSNRISNAELPRRILLATRRNSNVLTNAAVGAWLWPSNSIRSVKQPHPILRRLLIFT